jgi:tetratricopeptide (TPR) repeat protein
MQRLISQGMDALEQGDYAGLHALWAGTTVFSHLDDEATANAFARIRSAAEAGRGAQWPWLAMCLVYLDSSDQFTADRAEALRQVGQWAQRAISIAPGNAYGHRYVGSAHYWLDELAPALAAYRKSFALLPQADLQARIFEMEHGQPWRSISSFPELADSPVANDYYTAGVTVGKWKQAETDDAAAEEIQGLQMALYERCIARFASAGEAAGTQAPKAQDIHTYAMCCNNLGVLYNAQERHEEAAAVLEAGLQQTSFQALLENLRHAYRRLGNAKEATDLSLLLMEDYDLDNGLHLDCAQTACAHLNQTGHHQDVLDIVAEAERRFADRSLRERQDPWMLRSMAFVHAHKITALTAQGRLQASDLQPELIETALDNEPDDAQLLGLRTHMQQAQQRVGKKGGFWSRLFG